MNTESILFFLILGVIIGIPFLIIYIPIVLAKFRAKSFGLDLNWSEALIVRHNSTKEFLLSIKEIRSLTEVSILSLQAHFLAGGNLENVKQRIVELQKRKLEVTFSILSAIDLTGKDLKTEIINAETKKLVHIDGLRNAKIEINYTVQYKYSFPNSVFKAERDEELKTKIKDKIVTFLSSWEESDPFKTEHFLRNTILSIGYWENELRVILLNQEFEIKKISS